jgi:hypothetical protein
VLPAMIFNKIGQRPLFGSEWLHTVWIYSIALNVRVNEIRLRWSTGVMSGGVPFPQRAAPFDSRTTYRDMPNLPRLLEAFRYELLLKHAEAGWQRHAEHSSKPYALYVLAGWDPRSRGAPRPSFAFPTRDEWTHALTWAKAALGNYSSSGHRGRKRCC